MNCCCWIGVKELNICTNDELSWPLELKAGAGFRADWPLEVKEEKLAPPLVAWPLQRPSASARPSATEASAQTRAPANIGAPSIGSITSHSQTLASNWLSLSWFPSVDRQTECRSLALLSLVSALGCSVAESQNVARRSRLSAT